MRADAVGCLHPQQAGAAVTIGVRDGLGKDRLRFRQRELRGAAGGLKGAHAEVQRGVLQPLGADLSQTRRRVAPEQPHLVGGPVGIHAAPVVGLERHLAHGGGGVGMTVHPHGKGRRGCVRLDRHPDAAVNRRGDAAGKAFGRRQPVRPAIGGIDHAARIRLCVHGPHEAVRLLPGQDQIETFFGGREPRGGAVLRHLGMAGLVGGQRHREGRRRIPGHLRADPGRLQRIRQDLFLRGRDQGGGGEGRIAVFLVIVRQGDRRQGAQRYVHLPVAPEHVRIAHHQLAGIGHDLVQMGEVERQKVLLHPYAPPVVGEDVGLGRTRLRRGDAFGHGLPVRGLESVIGVEGEGIVLRCHRQCAAQGRAVLP